MILSAFNKSLFGLKVDGVIILNFLIRIVYNMIQYKNG